jgi:hypothetical protein
MSRFRIEENTLESLASRFFYLLWKACGSAVGRGWLQVQAQGEASDPEAAELQVYENVVGAGDYGINLGKRPGAVYGDYVIGRMMKVGFEHGVDEDGHWIEVSDEKARPDYQGWSGTYSTALEGLQAAASELSIELKE